MSKEKSDFIVVYREKHPKHSIASILGVSKDAATGVIAGLWRKVVF